MKQFDDNKTAVLIAADINMMTSSNGIIFRGTGHLCGEFTGPQWISSHKGQWRGALMLTLICSRINGWVNNLEAGDMRRHRAHYDVIVIRTQYVGKIAMKAETQICGYVSQNPTNIVAFIATSRTTGFKGTNNIHQMALSSQVDEVNYDNHYHNVKTYIKS